MFDKKTTFAKLNYTLNRSSHQGCSIKKGVLRNFTKFTGKRLCQSLSFNKVAGLRPARLSHRCFPVNFVKFLRTPFLQNTSGRLLPPKISQISQLLKDCLVIPRFLYQTNKIKMISKVILLQISS